MAEVMMSNSCVFSSSSPIHRHRGVSTVSIKSASRIRPFSIKSSSSSSQSNSNFHGRRFLSQGADTNYRSLSSINAQMITGIIGKAQKWWEKGLQPNMIEVQGAHDLVESLLTAGDRLVIVNFFSPGCGGCKALHPKICQFAEMNPDVQFLHMNYEEHKSMCYSLNVHVLPFFRFYRGAHGRLCSFSCTNATIKKFRDALAKHSPDRCSLGPPKGLEEKELLALAANKDLSFDYTPKPGIPIPVPAQEEILPETIPVLASHSERDHPLPLPLPLHHLPSTTNSNVAEDKTWVTSGR